MFSLIVNREKDDLDQGLQALFDDDGAEPADFGFTTRVMAHTDGRVKQQRQLRWVVVGGALAVGYGIAVSLANIGQSFVFQPDTLVGAGLTMGAFGVAMGAVSYALSQV